MLRAGPPDQTYHYQCLYRGKENRLEGGSSFSVTTEMVNLLEGIMALIAILSIRFHYIFITILICIIFYK